jgi:hypothetical protein
MKIKKALFSDVEFNIVVVPSDIIWRGSQIVDIRANLTV